MRRPRALQGLEHHSPTNTRPSVVAALAASASDEPTDVATHAGGG